MALGVPSALLNGMSAPTSRIPGVFFKPLIRRSDTRGWLSELYRSDELPDGFSPTMAYISLTHAGVVRGPHEHRHQTDGFCFLFGEFRLTLWENRDGRPRLREDHLVGESCPVFVTIPPGVVHCYANVGTADALVLNFPDRLYAGPGRSEPVDEIRHEDIHSEFRP